MYQSVAQFHEHSYGPFKQSRNTKICEGITSNQGILFLHRNKSDKTKEIVKTFEHHPVCVTFSFKTSFAV